MIRVEDLHKRFGSEVALDGLAFTVPKGEIFGFIGPNGAGKTTTMRILATLTRPDAGWAEIGGVRVDRDPAAVRQIVGYMPDFFGVYDRLTAFEYLRFYAASHGVSQPARSRVAEELLELVDLADRRDSEVDTLSRGMKQRLCLARSLVHDPAVLLLDEPASGLDPRGRLELRELLGELSRMGKTVLISSQVLPELEEMCSWIGLIHQGVMVASGPVDAIRSELADSDRLRITLADGEAADLESVAMRIHGCPGVVEVLVVGDHIEARIEPGFPEAELLAEVVRMGVGVRFFEPIRPDLTEVFLHLTQDQVAIEEKAG